MKSKSALAFLGITIATAAHGVAPIPSAAAIDSQAKSLMVATKANGLAVGVIDHGAVTYVRAFGIRDARGEPLTPDTVMYGASLTKTVFAYAVLKMVDEGRIQLDRPIADDLDRPLPT
ncbi:MAG TPA: serine hydrolase domain-containing protein [Opitutaceae bacterium]|jgi:CubicO group peptidase (beta-lactamase class C family)